MACLMCKLLALSTCNFYIVLPRVTQKPFQRKVPRHYLNQISELQAVTGTAIAATHVAIENL